MRSERTAVNSGIYAKLFKVNAGEVAERLKAAVC